MRDLNNNIFEWATKELSQDAVICWLLNWINYPNSELYGLAQEMFDLLGISDADSTQNITVHTQVKNADIVVVLHDKRTILIIEDKVYSSEHDDQIAQYRELLGQAENQKLLKIKDDTPVEDIRTVYFKTGFFYDDDLLVKADVVIDGDAFFSIVSQEKYSGKSEILDAYVAHLRELLRYYDDYGDFTIKKDGNWIISWHQIAQHNFMRYLFPEKWWNKETGCFKSEIGSSHGRPYTQSNIFVASFPDFTEKIYAFWRIDSTDKEGPYLSFRLYNFYNKKDDDAKKRHVDLYNDWLSICEKIIESNGLCFSWENVKGGFRGNYYEAALFTISLDDYLDDWSHKGEKLGADVRLITQTFLKAIEG